ncbi:MAG: hypothetical protein IKU43_10615 [Clostridia bacterium]|nr:hypothetical protein [Clostridia bacterium]
MLEARLANCDRRGFATTAEVIKEVDTLSESLKKASLKQTKYMSKNIFIQYKGVGASAFGFYGTLDNSPYMQYNEDIKNTAKGCGIAEDNGFYFAERDSLPDLPDYLPKHDRT